MSTQRQLRAINVQDALRYLDMIKVESDGQPEVYKEFLDIMKDFKLQK